MKTYMPQDLINNQWSYELNDNYYVIHTNQNCYYNYNTQYCDCIKVYPQLDYLVSNRFACYQGNYASLSVNNFTSDFWYRYDLSNILIIFLVLFIFIILFPYKIISRLFGRWLKV